jgi:hypothetical protein
MLGVPELKRGAETPVRVDFTGEAQGLRANASIKTQKDGSAQIRAPGPGLTPKCHCLISVSF